MASVPLIPSAENGTHNGSVETTERWHTQGKGREGQVAVKFKVSAKVLVIYQQVPGGELEQIPFEKDTVRGVEVSVDKKNATLLFKSGPWEIQPEGTNFYVFQKNDDRSYLVQDIVAKIDSASTHQYYTADAEFQVLEGTLCPGR